MILHSGAIALAISNILYDGIIIIYTGIYLNVANRNSIWISNFINNSNKQNLFVYLVTSNTLNITLNNFLKNIIDEKLLSIIKCKDCIHSKNKIEKIYSENKSKIADIIIENNY